MKHMLKLLGKKYSQFTIFKLKKVVISRLSQKFEAGTHMEFCHKATFMEEKKTISSSRKVKIITFLFNKDSLEGRVTSPGIKNSK